MQFSYSRVECFAKCPKQYKYRYVDRLKTLPDQSPSNALYLGTAIHEAFETGNVEDAIASYRSNYYVLTDEHINEEIKLEYLIPRVLELLPPGECEIEVSTENFIGYIDRLVYLYTDENNIKHYSIMDYKYSNAVDRYLESKQLHIYKAMFERTHLDSVVDSLYYVFVPKVAIRQKKTETLQEFRNRLQATLEETEIKIVEVDYCEESITQFESCCQALLTVNEFPKNETKLCDWCSYKAYCQSDGEVDWMIVNNLIDDNGGGIDLVALPKNERRTVCKPNKRVMWIYGKPFSGKTTLADAAPDVLMLNTDGNAQYATAPYVEIKDEITMNGRITNRKLAWEVFKEYISELEKGQNSYKTIVVDLLNDTYEMCRLYMYDKLKITHESDDTFKAWDKVRTEYLSTIRRVINLPYENIILISHEDDTKDLTKKSGTFSSMKPKMQDKVSDAIAGMVGFVGRAYVDEGNYMLEIKSDEVVFGGGRAGMSNIVIPLRWDEIVKLFEIETKSK